MYLAIFVIHLCLLQLQLLAGGGFTVIGKTIEGAAYQDVITQKLKDSVPTLKQLEDERKTLQDFLKNNANLQNVEVTVVGIEKATPDMLNSLKKQATEGEYSDRYRIVTIAFLHVNLKGLTQDQRNKYLEAIEMYAKAPEVLNMQSEPQYSDQDKEKIKEFNRHSEIWDKNYPKPDLNPDGDIVGFNLSLGKIVQQPK